MENIATNGKEALELIKKAKKGDIVFFDEAGPQMKLFVYGTLKKGFVYNYLLGGSKFLGESILDGYALYVNDVIPFIFKEEGKVHGEVYKIDEKIIEKLDSLEAAYNRKWVEVEVEGENMLVNVYVAKEKHEHYKKINSGIYKPVGEISI